MSPGHNGHMYENETPSGRPLSVSGQESANGEISDGFIGEFTVGSTMSFVICHKISLLIVIVYFANVKLMWLGLNKLVKGLQDSFFNHNATYYWHENLGGCISCH